MSNQENLYTQEIRKRVLELIKDDSGVTLNEYAGPLHQHKAFCDALGISETPWAESRKNQILAVGRAEAFKKADLTDRILSTDSITLPDYNILNVADDLAGGKAAATGPASAAESPPPPHYPGILSANQPAASAVGDLPGSSEPGKSFPRRS